MVNKNVAILHVHESTFVTSLAACVSYLTLDGHTEHLDVLAAGASSHAGTSNLSLPSHIQPHSFWESIRAGAGTVPRVKPISRSLAQLRSALPVLWARRAETGGVRGTQQMVGRDVKLSPLIYAPLYARRNRGKAVIHQIIPLFSAHGICFMTNSL